MNWVRAGVGWAPALHTPDHEAPDSDALLDTLDRALVRNITKHPLSALADEHGIVKCVKGATPQNREDSADWLSALRSDLAPNATSQVQTARRDYFFDNLKSILANTRREHLRRALFASWDYADPLHNRSLHIDPTEDRRHAYQWHMPSGDPTRKIRGGMLGANRLAIEAFPFLQSFVVGDRIRTRGFTGRRASNTRWTWPIWSCRLGSSVIASLLGLPELQAAQPDVQRLRARGIVTAFRSRRILVGKTPNFTPAVAVF